MNRQYVHVGFSQRNKIPRNSAYTISEKAIRFRHPDYNPDRAQKLISLSMSRHLSTRNISSKSMDAFLSNLANRQTDIQTRPIEFTSSFVGGNCEHMYIVSQKVYLLMFDNNLANVDRSQNSFTKWFVGKFPTYTPQRFPPHLQYVATLPCES